MAGVTRAGLLSFSGVLNISFGGKKFRNPATDRYIINIKFHTGLNKKQQFFLLLLFLFFNSSPILENLTSGKALGERAVK